MIDQKTNTKAQTFVSMFQYQESIYNNAFENLENDTALVRPLTTANHMNWLLGHVLHCRYMLANMLGVEDQNPFGNLYWEKLEGENFKSIEEIKALFPSISEKLMRQIGSMTDEQLDNKSAPEKPALSDIISFFIYHEAYHIGQLGYARRLVGLEPMKSN